MNIKIKPETFWYFHGVNSPAADNGKAVLEMATYTKSIAHPAATLRIVINDATVLPNDPETSRQMRDGERDAILRRLGFIIE